MIKYKLEPFEKLSKISLEGKKVDANCIISNKLSDIDLFTSNFENEEELKKYFKLEGIDDLYIYYNYKGERKIRPLFKDDEAMHLYTNEDSIYVSKATPYFKKDFNALLDSALHNKKYIEFLHKNAYMDDYTYRKLNDYCDAYASMNNDSMNLKKLIVTQLMDKISNYKCLRDLYLGTRAYEKEYNVNQEIEAEDEHIYNKTIDDYLDEQERDLYEVYLKGGIEEVMNLTEGFISPRLMQKISESSKTR